MRATLEFKYNSGFKTLEPITIELKDDRYVFGRAENEDEFGKGDEKELRKRLYDKVKKAPNDVIPILNKYEELKKIPSVYIVKHLVHSNKITIPPFIFRASRRIGLFSWNNDIKRYIFESSEPCVAVVGGKLLDLHEHVILENGQKLLTERGALEAKIKYH